MYLSLTGFAPPFCFLLSAFYFGLVVALGSFGPAFILHPSAFILHFGVALVSHWCRIGVALGWL